MKFNMMKMKMIKILILIFFQNIQELLKKKIKKEKK